MHPATMLMRDTPKDVFYIVPNWAKDIPKDLDFVFTFSENPYPNFKRMLVDGFGGIMYVHKEKFIAVTYPGKPKFCDKVMFGTNGTMSINELIDFIIELQDTNSLP